MKNSHDYFLKKLALYGPVVSKKLFGTFGFYLHGVIFAIIINDELYFRVDEATRADFETYKARQFIYEARGRPVCMPYFAVPDHLFENLDLLSTWVEKAYQAALGNLRKKQRKKNTLTKNKRVPLPDDDNWR